MSTFQIQISDGTFSTVSHKEFFETLNNGDGYLYYKQGGRHIAMLPTATNEETLRTCRQAENAENYEFAVNSRCIDEKGHLCRYQHDENGSIIRNEEGKPVSAKCGNCPRDGWIAGSRANCCIRNYCRIEDCAYCTNHREYRVPLSLERFVDDEYDGNEYDGTGFSVVDTQTDIQTAVENDELTSALYIAVSQLSEDEQSIIKAIYWGNLSQRAYASEHGISKDRARRLHDRALETLKNSLKSFH